MREKRKLNRNRVFLEIKKTLLGGVWNIIKYIGGFSFIIYVFYLGWDILVKVSSSTYLSYILIVFLFLLSNYIMSIKCSEKFLIETIENRGWLYFIEFVILLTSIYVIKGIHLSMYFFNVLILKISSEINIQDYYGACVTVFFGNILTCFVLGFFLGSIFEDSFEKKVKKEKTKRKFDIKELYKDE